MGSRWVFGPAPDLLLGCGFGWMVAFLVQGYVGSESLAMWAPAGLLVMVSAIPHYGATLLRVYESPEDRRKYALFAVHISVGLVLLYAAGLYSARLGSLLLTVYLTWSPWHYTGQNYGIALMLMGRRGVTVTSEAKRWLHASFVLSFALTFVAIHGVVDTASYAPVSYDGTEFHLMKLGIPAQVCGILVPLLTLGYTGSLATAVVLLGRAGRLAALAPALVLMTTQALWFALPVVIRHWQLAGPDSFFAQVLTPYGFIWIATAHAVQYLWITSYFARTSGSETSTPRYLGKAALAGYAIWTVPALLFAPGLLGRLPYDAGLALLTAAIVNLHHFVLDGAIWKLRDGRIAGVLLRSEPGTPASASGGAWLRPLVWSAGALSIAVAFVALYEDVFGFRHAIERNDLGRARTAASRMAWIGRDGPTLHRELARALARSGQGQAAKLELRTSLSLYPTAGAWIELSRLQEADGELEEAAHSLGEALVLAPDNVQALYDAGRLRLELGQVRPALVRLERAAELAPEQGVVQLTLERAQRMWERRLAGEE